MNQSQQELRHAATQAFMESLDQLGMSLATEEEKPPETKTAPVSRKTTDAQFMSVEALEEAVADIEQFIQDRQESSLEQDS